jgi:hypothetical protein
MSIREIMKKAGVVFEVSRSLTYEEYCAMMAIACPHGPDEPCTCDGCHEGKTGCTGHVYGCTCDIYWDLMQDIRDMWYA